MCASAAVRAIVKPNAVSAALLPPLKQLPPTPPPPSLNTNTVHLLFSHNSHLSCHKTPTSSSSSPHFPSPTNPTQPINPPPCKTRSHTRYIHHHHPLLPNQQHPTYTHNTSPLMTLSFITSATLQQSLPLSPNMANVPHHHTDDDSKDYSRTTPFSQHIPIPSQLHQHQQQQQQPQQQPQQPQPQQQQHSQQQQLQLPLQQHQPQQPQQQHQHHHQPHQQPHQRHQRHQRHHQQQQTQHQAQLQPQQHHHHLQQQQQQQQQQQSIPHSSPIPHQYQPSPDPPRRADQLNYDLFPDISVPPIVQTSPHDISRDPPHFSLDPKPSHPHQQTHDRKQQDSSFYASLPLAPASSRVTKRPSRPDIHDQSSSPSIQSPSHPHRSALSAQSSLERRKAHRAYTQKSRNKVNSRFEALLDALPTPPPRLNPRSKAEILEYATETVIRLVSQNNKLELHLALSSSPQLEAWLSEQTKTARTVHEVCQPIMRLFTIGLEWKGAEVWAIDSRAPMTTASLGQAWTFVPPPSGRRPSRDDEARIAELTAFLDSGKGAYHTTTSSEALAVVYRTGKPAWLSCEYKASLGFEENPDFQTERTRLAQTYGITDVLFVPLILYNHVQIVVNFYNMRSRSPSESPALQPQIDPKSSIKVASEAINIIARRFCSLPGVSEFAEQ